MNWTQYEVWAEMDGHQELIETTASKKEAIQLAERTLTMVLTLFRCLKKPQMVTTPSSKN